jgi:hypothetical protein
MSQYISLVLGKLPLYILEINCLITCAKLVLKYRVTIKDSFVFKTLYCVERMNHL